MGKKTPPCKQHPKWTEARFWSFVRSALRRAWTKWPPKYEVLAENKRVVTGKRHKAEYKCAECKKWFKQSEVSVDHITPAGSLRNWDDVPKFAERLFCGKDELQVLCTSCHNEKTREERKNNDI